VRQVGNLRERYSGQQHEAHKPIAHIFMTRINTNLPPTFGHLNLFCRDFQLNILEYFHAKFMSD